MNIRTALSAGTAGVMALSMSLVIVPSARADVITPGSFNTVSSSRILDTRNGIGAPEVPIAAGGTLTFTATAGIKIPVSSVVLNVTAVDTKKAGYLTVYAAGLPRPNASSVNFQAGQNVANAVVAPVSSTGKVSIFNGSSGTIDVLADIHGFFVGGASTGVPGTFVSMAPARFLDTRHAIGTTTHRVAANSVTTFDVAGRGGVPAGATAVVMNVTAVLGGGSGYVTAYAGSPLPLASTVNYRTYQDRANLATVELGTDGTISLFNGSKSTVDLVADVTGYFVGGGVPEIDGAFVPSTPFRVFDSRGPGGRPAGARSISKIQVFPLGDPTFAAFKAIVINVTAASPQATGYLTTWEGDSPLRSVSSSNFVPHQNSAGTVVTPVAADGSISIYNGSSGTVDLVVDVTGFFFTPPAQPNATSPQMSASVSKSRIAEALRKMKQFSASPASVPVLVTHSH